MSGFSPQGGGARAVQALAGHAESSLRSLEGYRRAFQVLEHCDSATTVDSFAERALESLSRAFGIRYTSFFCGNSFTDVYRDPRAMVRGGAMVRTMMSEYQEHWHVWDPFATAGPQARLRDTGVASLCENYILPPSAAHYVTTFLRGRSIESGTALFLPLPGGRICLIGLFDPDPAAVTPPDLSVLRHLRRQLAVLARGLNPSSNASLLFPKLTPRQQDVAILVARGMTNASIGAQLHLTEDTVKKYVSRVLARAGCATRTELATAVQREQMTV